MQYWKSLSARQKLLNIKMHAENGANCKKAAEKLGVTPETVRRFLFKFDLNWGCAKTITGNEEPYQAKEEQEDAFLHAPQQCDEMLALLYEHHGDTRGPKATAPTEPLFRGELPMRSNVPTYMPSQSSL
ncbi:helix-turn-helix domain-containing protein [Pseudovibrio ascidiaceicola]|uniref:helix-turn-helix domain-containing protein n=1 Tax=Pseudovibrio ascidiaceicola TaxID=285279 RepID=UPI003D35C42B